MSPFREATIQQIQRLLAIVAYYEKGNGGIPPHFLLTWTQAESLQPEFSTEETIQYWENVIRGEQS